MVRSFQDYVLLREMDEKMPPKRGVGSSITLGGGNDFKPFTVTDDPRNPHFPSNKNLAPIVRAFKEAGKVNVYNSLDKDGNPKGHTIGSKRLFMVGGAVRDHLLGKTPKDIDLVTDASPEEIKLILLGNGFRNSEDGKGGSKSFYVKGKDKSGKEFVFGVLVDGQEFDLATFRKDSHGSDGRHPDQMSFGSHEDDSSRRDLTVNSLYLQLTNPDGPNNKVTDFHGGVHDLLSGRVRFVGNASERLDEDLLRALRYARFAAAFSREDIPEDMVKTIRGVVPKIKEIISPERIQQEFAKGIEDENVDPERFLEIYEKLGLLDVVFPGLHVDHDGIMSHDRDRSLILAGLLRHNHPGQVKEILFKQKWPNHDIDRVGFLHGILGLGHHSQPEDLDRHLVNFARTGVMPNTVKNWWMLNNRPPAVAKAFLDLAMQPRVRVTHDDPDFADLFDPVALTPLPGMGIEIGKRKRQKEHNNFRDLLHKHTKR